MSTPMRDVRRLPFNRRDSDGTRRRYSLRQSVLPPSPYTPFSGRRSGTLPPGTPIVEGGNPFQTKKSMTTHSNRNLIPPTSTTPNVENVSADEFVRTKLDSNIRSSTVNLLSTLSSKVRDEEKSKFMLDGIRDELRKQVKLAESFLNERSAQPHIRRELENSIIALRTELSTWDLINTMWRSIDYRTRDFTTTRLALDRLDQTIIDNVSGIEKCHRITEWLEYLAAEELDRNGGPRVKPLEDPAYRCAYSAQAEGVPSVGMDYSIGENRKLDEIELKADERICREIFKLLRAGRGSDAESICRAAGQPWRAAILSGGRNCSSLSANGVKGGARRVWRNTVAKTVKAGQALPIYERALYGLLAGVKEPALAIATDYESRAWVHFITTIDNACDKALLSSADGCAITDEAIIQMFDECDGAGDGHPSIPSDINAGIRKIRSYFALGRSMSQRHASELLMTLGNLAYDGLRHNKEWVCRLVSNLALYMKLDNLAIVALEDEDSMNNFESAMSAYARHVIHKEKEEEEAAERTNQIREVRPLVSELAAWQLSELENNIHIVREYSVLLYNALRNDLRHERAERKRVGSPEHEVYVRRERCLEYAGACFNRDTLDKLVVHVVDYVWDRFMNDLNNHSNSNAVADEITEDDELIIRSIDLLIFPTCPNHEQATIRATIAIRRFFLLGKHSAAKHLIEWFPQIDDIRNSSNGNSSSSIMPLREIDAWREYIEAKHAFQAWQDYHFTKKPKPLPEAIRLAASADKGTYSYEIKAAASVQMKKYEQKYEMFKKNADQLRDVAKNQLRQALLFDSGWMRAVANEVEEMEFELDEAGREIHEQRREEMRAVRRWAVPELVWLLHRVLHESGLYDEAVEVAILVAGDACKLYECFGKSEMKSLLARIAESSVLLADGVIKSGTTSRPYKGLFFEEF